MTATSKGKILTFLPVLRSSQIIHDPLQRSLAGFFDALYGCQIAQLCFFCFLVRWVLDISLNATIPLLSLLENPLV